MSEIDYSLLNDFIVEASEHLEEMESRLLALVPDGDNSGHWNEIFRPIHTIKGAAQFVGLDRVALLSHRLEDLLDLLRQDAFPAGQAVIDILIEGRDRIAHLVKDLETSESEETPVDDLVARVVWLIDHQGQPPDDNAAAVDGVKPEAEPESPPEVDASLTSQLGPTEESEQLNEEVAAALAAMDLRTDEESWDQRTDTVFFQQQPVFSVVDPAPEQTATGADDPFSDEGELSPVPVLEFEEEYDQELFQIYIEQLRDKAGLLGMLVRALDGSDEGLDILTECRHHVSQLRSAANYMGYAPLLSHYDEWLSMMEGASDLIAQGHVVDLSFMPVFFNRLLASVPDLTDLPPVEWEGIPMEQEPIQPQLFQTPARGLAEAAEQSQPVPSQSAEFEGVDGTEGPEFEQEDVEDFINESVEHLDEMETGLLRFDSEPDNRELLDDVFRAAHTIKGVAQFIGLARISAICHRMEDLLSRVRQGGCDATPLVLTVLLAAKDRLSRLVEDLIQSRREASPVDDLLRRMDLAIQGAEGIAVQPRAEDYDRELYAIFVDQLADYLGRIRAARAEYQAAPDGLAELQRLAEMVRHLRHAAVYMDYTDLSELYDDWLGDLGQAEFQLMAGERPDLEFIFYYIDRIEVQFPEIGGKSPELISEASEAPSEPEKVELEAPAAAASPEAELQVSAEETAPTAVVEESSPASDEDELFIRLTEALEGGFAQESDREYETLHGVFEQMFGAEKAEPAKAVPAPAKAAPVLTPAAKTSAPARAAPAVSAAPAAQAAPAEAEGKKGAVAQPTEVRANAAEKEETGKASVSGGGAGKPPAEGEPVAEGEDDKKKGERAFKKSVRVDADKIDSLMNQVGELIVDRSYFYQLYSEMNDLQRHLRDELGVDQRDLKQVRTFTYRLGEAISSLSRTSNELQEGVMKVRMLPIAQIFNRYPRLIHDLTRNTNKKVNLVIRGEETELDKMIVEELSDPMIHIIRNAVDHGFETVDERKRLGKPETGTLVVEAYQESNHIVIEVNDDGRGIDPERIKAKALERKLHSKDELDRMTSRDLIRLIMQPGFSTANQITRTSGRGVGMDVAKQNVEKLNGTIEVDSQPGRSTQIRLKIPLTLAIIPALLVRVGADSFTIPLSNVEETMRINDAETSAIEGTEVVHLRGRTMPIFRLDNLFSIKGDAHEDAKSFVVIVNAGAEQIGLVVDELMGQEEVVIKPLVDYLQEKSGFSGATIIGDGRISLILDVYELVHMTAVGQATRLRGREYQRKAGLERSKQQPIQEKGDAPRPTVH